MSKRSGIPLINAESWSCFHFSKVCVGWVACIQMEQSRKESKDFIFKCVQIFASLQIGLAHQKRIFSSLGLCLAHLLLLRELPKAMCPAEMVTYYTTQPMADPRVVPGHWTIIWSVTWIFFKPRSNDNSLDQSDSILLFFLGWRLLKKTIICSGSRMRKTVRSRGRKNIWKI